LSAGQQHSWFSARYVHVIAGVPALNQDEPSIPWVKIDMRSH
jgi:hypothetical protein